MPTIGASRRAFRDILHGRSSRTGAQSVERKQLAGLEETTLDPAHPRPWHAPVTTVSVRLWRQLLGLNPFKGTYFGLYGSLQSTQDRTIVFCGAAFAIAAGIPLPIIGVIFGKIITNFPPDEEELQSRISQLLAVAVAFFAVTTVCTVSFGLAGDRIAVRLRERLLYSFLRLEQAYLDTRNIDINVLLSEEIDTIQVGCSEKVGIFLQSMSYFVAAFTVGFILNAKLTGILLAAVLPTMTIVVSVGSTTISKLSHKISSHTVRVNGIVESSLRAVKVVQAFDMIEQMCSTHGQYLAQSGKDGFRKAVVSALELGGAYFTAYAANGLAFFIGSHMAASGEAGGDPGTIYAVVFLIIDASFVVGQFAPFLEIFARAASAYGAIQEIIEACPKRKLPLLSSGDADTFDMHGQDLCLTNVSFSYPARPTVPAIHGMNLTVRPSSITAIVGCSGGGKSTLISLLLGIYDYSGQILVGLRELRTLERNLTRSQIAVLDQDCVLLSGTIYDNICHGLAHQGISNLERDKLCWQAAKDAAVDFLDDLPQGIHTQIDNTLKLSGGQRQRICLARALIQKPAILILDEPTSALDGQSEVKVMQAIRKAVANGTTVLMIAHRLSTVVEADHVAVVSDGRVIEAGEPVLLSQGNTVFHGLLDAQNTNVAGNEPGSYFEADVLPKCSQQSQSSTDSMGKADNNSLEWHTTSVGMSTRKIVVNFLRFTQAEQKIILAGLLASTLSGCIIMGEAVVFGNLVQLLNSDGRNSGFQQQADFYCLMFFVLACIALVSYVGSGSAFGVASNRLISRIQGALLQHVLHLDIEWFSKPGRSAHELSSTFAKDTSDLACLSGVALGTILTVITSVFGGIILSHAIAWKIAVVLLVAVPVMIASGYMRLRMLAKSETRHRTKYKEATALAIEACRNRRTVAVLGIEDLILRQYQESLFKPQKNGLVFTMLCNTLLAFPLAITYFVYALAYWWGAKQVRSGLYSQKQFFTVLPALLFSAQAAGQLFSLSPEIARANRAAVNIFQILGSEPKMMRYDTVQPDERLEQAADSTSETPLREKVPEIEFREVTFSYKASVTQTALQGVSFSIAAGEIVALVGPSGAGKSSTIGLMERFYDPTTGKVLFQGTEGSQIDIRLLRRRMALVPQEPQLFPGSVGYNIKLGAGQRSSTISQDLVEKTAKRCGLHAFISSLPQGYDTNCGSVGDSQLSEGQRQRLSLARALVSDPAVLLLDEPTSALDAHSERQVQEALQEAAQGLTIVIVAHRLASIQHVDRIIVFDRGKVVEQGTHTELVQQGGLYSSMAKAQALS